MIGKISVPRGTRVEPLIYYLFGPGRREEHADPHLVAGWRHPAELEPPLGPGGTRDFRRLLGLLNQPHAALGERGHARPVWHCAMRAAPEDKVLSDDEWAQVACDVMHRTGLAPYGQDDDAVRWVAVRHGVDHVHIVAMLARQDGGKPCLPHERYQVRAACLAAEARYGLRSTAPADRTAPRCPSRAETEKATRHGRGEAPRVTLRRHVITAAAASADPAQFLARLREAGVIVRVRYSTADPGEVTGYAVALPGDTARDGKPVWYGGGKLAADLTWPKLTQRWRPGPAPLTGDQLTAAERTTIWDHAISAAADAAAQIRADPAGAADAAWAAGDALHAAAATLGSPTLRQAADAFDRAARPAYGKAQPPAPAGIRLRHAARLISMCADLAGQPAPITLIIGLAALAEAIADLRAAQQHAAQAQAARAAAQVLHAGVSPARAGPPRQAARLAALAFPATIRPTPRPRPAGESQAEGATPSPPRRARPARQAAPGAATRGRRA